MEKMSKEELQELLENKVFSEFGFCNCGRPCDVLEKMYKILKQDGSERLFKISDDDLLYAYLLDKYGYIEHYTTINFASRTEKALEFMTDYEEAYGSEAEDDTK